MKKYLITLIYCSYSFAVLAQLDLSKYVKPVYEGVESTALSIFDTNPESPDGKYLAFLKYNKIVQGGHSGSPVGAYLMIKNRKTKEIKKSVQHG
ncbi:MAG: hypothetical protein AAGI07_12595 [Bacteroidota bacterium]